MTIESPQQTWYQRKMEDQHISSKPLPEIVLEPRTGIQFLDFKELYTYRDLFWFLIWRQLKVRYAQSAIGIGWAIIQPLFSMLVFTVIFGNLAEIDSNGAPYALFSLAALLPWTYFSNSVTDGIASLVTEANMLKKIYFPRILLPASAVVAKLIDLGIAGVMMAILMIIYQQLPTTQIFLLPLGILLMVITASGISIWLTAMAVQYRDVKHAISFILQIAMYASPVVYSVSIIPAEWQLLFGINPMVGVIEVFRTSLLGTGEIRWDLLAVGTISAVTILISGIIFFRGKEKAFADVA